MGNIMLTKQIPKIELEKLFQELPEMIEIEEVMYRLYLFQKIQEGETDIQEGRTLSHTQALERLSQKWQN
jgi:hypothetical protein